MTEMFTQEDSSRSIHAGARDLALTIHHALEYSKLVVYALQISHVNDDHLLEVQP